MSVKNTKPELIMLIGVVSYQLQTVVEKHNRREEMGFQIDCSITPQNMRDKPLSR